MYYIIAWACIIYCAIQFRKWYKDRLEEERYKGYIDGFCDRIQTNLEEKED